MKLAIISLLMLLSALSYGQTTISYEQVSQTNDPKILSEFIVQNPYHPQIEVLKQRLNLIINKQEQDAQMATDIINHLIENDPNKAYISYLKKKGEYW